MKREELDDLGDRIEDEALRAFVRLCPEVRASSERIESALAAMRATSKGV